MKTVDSSLPWRGEGWRVLFDAIPAWIFLVDQDIRILEYNRSAASLLGPDPAQTIGQRGGDVLHCIQAEKTAEGCGHEPRCHDCIVRNAVRSCYEARTVTRRRHRMELRRGSEMVNLYVLVSVSPVDFGDRRLALLMLEDISELTELERIIPICAGCRQVRLESSAWQPVEQHLRDRLDLEFTHGLCPDCLKRYGA